MRKASQTTEDLEPAPAWPVLVHFAAEGLLIASNRYTTAEGTYDPAKGLVEARIGGREMLLSIHSAGISGVQLLRASSKR